LKAEKHGASQFFAEIAGAIREMPATMKQLAVVQIFTWLGLFCMWMFFGLTTSYHVFHAPDAQSELFRKGGEWAGIAFAVYSVVCLIVALAFNPISNAALSLVAVAIYSVVHVFSVYVMGIPGTPARFLLAAAGCCALVPGIRWLGGNVSRKLFHSFSFVCGAVGLLSVFLLTIVWFAIAWASILSIPYPILSRSLPPARMGVYRGVFNFFIVIPEIV